MACEFKLICEEQTQFMNVARTSQLLDVAVLRINFYSMSEHQKSK